MCIAYSLICEPHLYPHLLFCRCFLNYKFTGELVHLRWAKTITIGLLYLFYRRVSQAYCMSVRRRAFPTIFLCLIRKKDLQTFNFLVFISAICFRWKTTSKNMTSTSCLLRERIAPMSIADPNALKYFAFKLIWICCSSASAFFRSYSFICSRFCRRNSCSCC